MADKHGRDRGGRGSQINRASSLGGDDYDRRFENFHTEQINLRDSRRGYTERQLLDQFGYPSSQTPVDNEVLDRARRGARLSYDELLESVDLDLTPRQRDNFYAQYNWRERLRIERENLLVGSLRGSVLGAAAFVGLSEYFDDLAHGVGVGLRTGNFFLADRAARNIVDAYFADLATSAEPLGAGIAGFLADFGIAVEVPPDNPFEDYTPAPPEYSREERFPSGYHPSIDRLYRDRRGALRTAAGNQAGIQRDAFLPSFRRAYPSGFHPSVDRTVDNRRGFRAWLARNPLYDYGVIREQQRRAALAFPHPSQARFHLNEARYVAYNVWQLGFDDRNTYRLLTASPLPEPPRVGGGSHLENFWDDVTDIPRALQQAGTDIVDNVQGFFEGGWREYAAQISDDIAGLVETLTGTDDDSGGGSDYNGDDNIGDFGEGYGAGR